MPNKINDNVLKGAMMTISKPAFFESFSTKLGIILFSVVTSVTGTSLLFFYNYTHGQIKLQVQGRLTDIVKTATYVFDTSDRQIIENYREQLNRQLLEQKDIGIEKLEKGDSQIIFSSEQVNSLIQNAEFQYLVQLLRYVQSGSSANIGPMEIQTQANLYDANRPTVSSAYLMAKIPSYHESDAIVFLADSNWQDIDSNEDGKITGNEQGNPPSSIYKADPAELVSPFKSKMAYVSSDWYEDAWGVAMSATAPILNTRGEVVAVLGIDYDVSVITKELNNIKMISISIFLIAIFVSIAASFIISILVNRPLGKLVNGAAHLARKEFKLPIKLNRNDEFSILASVINDAAAELAQFTQNLELKVAERTKELGNAAEKIDLLNNKLLEENANLGADASYMVRLREHFLPQSNIRILDKYNVQISHAFTKNLAGDFVNYNHRRNSMLIGNAVGNGIETILISLCTQIFWTRPTHNLAMEDILNQLNDMIAKLNQSFEKQSAVFWLNLDFTEQSILLCGNMEGLFTVNNGTVAHLELDSLSLPLGIDENNLLISEVDIAFNQLIYFVSPGLLNVLTETDSLDEFMKLIVMGESPEKIIEIFGNAHDVNEAYEDWLVMKIQK